MKLIIKKPDTLGALASSLCIVHCLATPMIFIVHSCSAGGCDAAPSWWKNLDYFFLTISFFAIYRSVQTTSKNFMKYALWISWCILFALIVNENQKWIFLSETYVYVSAISLSILHIYNLKYCQCKTQHCCNEKQN